MSISRLMQMAAAGAGGDYQISRSLRFNSADSAYLSRTPASAGDRKTWTWSGWVKRGTLGTAQWVFDAFTDANNFTAFFFNADDTFGIQYLNGATTKLLKYTTQVFRDPSAWYHIVISVDTTQITPVFNLYVNGTQVTAFGTNTNTVTQNTDLDVNNTVAHNIGRYGGSGNYLAAYSTEINFIDGQALTPTSFGETNETTGVWSPKRFSGPWNVGTGVNGFYLNFSDNSDVTAATLGADYSGNGNNWTPSGFSVTAGAGNDSLVDTPTPYGDDTGAGGEVRGNYATLNPLRSKNSPTFSQGNMRVTDTTPAFGMTITTIPPVSGDKIYGEATVASNTSGASVVGFGFTDVASGAALPDPGDANLYIFYGNANGNIYNGASLVTSGLGAPTAGTVLQVAYDKSNGYAWVGKANTWYDSTGGSTGDPSAGTNPTFTLTSNNLNFYVMAYNNSLDINFGQRPFAYTAPSGFKALVTTNLPEPTVVQGDDYFNTVLYTGTGAAGNAVTGVGFAPDWVWLKSRSQPYSHTLYDVLRGRANGLLSDGTSGDVASAAGNDFVSFDSDGFTVGTFENFNTPNNVLSNPVAWNWKAGVSNVTNGDGTITSTVRANTTSGFSIVTYTGSGANATVGHGLGVQPFMVIVKNRDNGAAGWYVEHIKLTGFGTYTIFLNQTSAESANSAHWNDTAPTSSVFSVGTSGGTNESGSSHVAYCFAEVEGFSKFGSYTGNASADGPFVYTGFRPAFVMVKSSSSAVGNWLMQNNKTLGYNPSNSELYANLTNAETTADRADLLSNGFKPRVNSAENNSSGVTYIYMAFAENPFKNSLAR
jgi:hypothetical protein